MTGRSDSIALARRPPTRRSPTTAVIFDLDNTLLDDVAAGRAGVSAWLASIGVPASEELVRYWFEVQHHYFSLFDRDEVDDLGQRRGRIAAMLERLGRTVPAERELDRMFAVFRDAYASAWRPFDDVADALDRLGAMGLRVAVLTNCDSRLALAKLASLGIAGRIAGLFCPDTLHCHKPDTRAFRATCDALGVKPAHALMVGDIYRLDIHPALDAGLRAVLLDRTQAVASLDATRIHSLRELATLI